MSAHAAGHSTPAEIERLRAAATTHGMEGAFAKTGDETTLQPTQRAELAATREELATPAGARSVMIELGANAVQVYRWGFAWLADLARREGAVRAFEAPMLARFFTAQESARRCLEALARLPDPDAGGDPAAIAGKYRSTPEGDAHV